MSEGAYPKLPPESHPMDDQAASPVKQPQQPGGGQPTMTTTTIHMPPASGQQFRWGEHPQSVTCEHCSADVITDTYQKGGLVAWATCGSCFFVGLFTVIPLFLCWVPFCVAPLKDTYHKCPACQKSLGKRGALGLTI